MLRRNWKEIILTDGMALAAGLILFGALIATAKAQTAVEICIPAQDATTGGLRCTPITNFNSAPNANTLTSTAVTCAATSTPFGVSGTSYMSVQIPAGGVTTCFAWGSGATATLVPPSQCYPAGSNISWGGGTGACIVTTGTQAVSVETK